jgi:hypothetical protein
MANQDFGNQILPAVANVLAGGPLPSQYSPLSTSDMVSGSTGIVLQDQALVPTQSNDDVVAYLISQNPSKIPQGVLITLDSFDTRDGEDEGVSIKSVVEYWTLRLDCLYLFSSAFDANGLNSWARFRKALKVMQQNLILTRTLGLLNFNYQTISIAGASLGGTFTLTAPGSFFDSPPLGTTTALAYDATALQVQTALNEIDGVSLTASGGPLPGTPILLNIGSSQFSQLLQSTSSLTGSNPNISIEAAGQPDNAVRNHLMKSTRPIDVQAFGVGTTGYEVHLGMFQVEVTNEIYILAPEF